MHTVLVSTSQHGMGTEHKKCEHDKISSCGTAEMPPSPLWKCSAGTMEMTEKSMDIVFDTFWVDVGEDSLREQIEPNSRSDATQDRWDSLISWMGRLGFIRPLAVFPVLYLDSDMCVFRFPPLASNIAVTKL